MYYLCWISSPGLLGKCLPKEKAEERVSLLLGTKEASSRERCWCHPTVCTDISNSSWISCLPPFHIFINYLDKSQLSDSCVKTVFSHQVYHSHWEVYLLPSSYNFIPPNITYLIRFSVKFILTKLDWNGAKKKKSLWRYGKKGKKITKLIIKMIRKLNLFLLYLLYYCLMVWPFIVSCLHHCKSIPIYP